MLFLSVPFLFGLRYRSAGSGRFLLYPSAKLLPLTDVLLSHCLLASAFLLLFEAYLMAPRVAPIESIDDWLGLIRV